jgi:hypothetical protein
MYSGGERLTSRTRRAYPSLAQQFEQMGTSGHQADPDDNNRGKLQDRTIPHHVRQSLPCLRPRFDSQWILETTWRCRHTMGTGPPMREQKSDWPCPTVRGNKGQSSFPPPGTLLQPQIAGSTILVRTLDLRLLESVSDSAMFADAEPPATFNFIIGLVVLFLRVKELQPRALLEHRRHPRYRGRDALLSRISATGTPLITR